MKLETLAYHSTSAEAAAKIVRRGFRVPKKPSESITDAPVVGDFYPAIFFARDPKNALYGPVIIPVWLSGNFLPWRSRRGESLSDTLHRLISKARDEGYDGVIGPSDTVGIAVIDADVIKLVEMR